MMTALPPPGACALPEVPPQLIVAAVPESVRPARKYVRAAVAYQEPAVPEDALGTLEIIASELVTNAILYGAPSPDTLIRVVVEAEPHHARIEVHDGCCKTPHIRPLSTKRSRGRGLLLVTDMAATWGTDERAAGKIVWAVVTW
ncbi:MULTISPECIES: ATP-binding protein [unclassified Streptomyces]|uniref:ATP-binding protein n=1 Tax=Streptomyces sp. NPDC055082 TaxID=3365718 RepID=UPI0037D1C456